MEDVKSDKVESAFPGDLKRHWDTLCEQTIDNQEPLSVCIVGAFSSGKSSLLNMLMGESKLPVGIKETTAIPVVIRYGEQWQFGRANRNGDEEVIDEEAFRQLSTTVTEEGQYATVSAPSDWLRGLEVLDLPGLGSTDEAKSSMTRAQVEAADVVLYLLENRGPKREDIEHLATAHRRGKPVCLMVGKWDQVEKSAEQGEKKVDLEEWSEDIRKETGLNASLIGVSDKGEGRQEVLEFLDHVKGKRDVIRRQRFEKRGLVLVDKAISFLEEELEALSARAEEEREEIRSRLTKKRAELAELRSQLAEEREKQHEAMLEDFGDAYESCESSLQKRLASPIEDACEIANEAAWSRLLQSANEEGERVLDELVDRTQEISKKSTSAGDISGKWESLSYAFPVSDYLDEDDWYDSARIGELESQLQALGQEVQALEKVEVSDANVKRRDELLEELHKLSAHRQKLESSAVPMVEKQLDGHRLGTTLGRMVGEAADVALIALQPQVVVSKLTSLLGKGAKATKAAEFAGKIVKGTKGVQALDKTSKLGQVASKLGFLDKLSIGYWAERLGSFFDADSEIVLEVDHAALEAREQKMEQVGAEVSSLQSRLSQLEQELQSKEHSEYEREKKLEQQKRLEKRLEQERKRVERQKAQLDSYRAELRAKQVRRKAPLVLERAKQRLNRQARGLERQLMVSFRDYWDEQLEEAVSDHEQQLEKLEARLESPEATKAEQATDVRARIEVLHELRDDFTSSARPSI